MLSRRKTLHNMKGESFDNDIMIIKNSWLVPCDSHKTILVPNRLTLFFSFEFQNGEDKSNPKEGQRGTWLEDQDPGPSACGANTSSTGGPPRTSTRNLSQSGGEEQKYRGGEVTGTSGEVTRGITNLTVGPDGCRGWAIYTGGRSQLTRSSDLPWEAKPPRRNSCRLHGRRSPKSTIWGQWLFMKSAGFKRAWSSSFGKGPSHS